MAHNPKPSGARTHRGPVGGRLIDAPSRGDALKTAVHVARAQRGIRSDRALTELAGVRYQTLMDWYAGRTAPSTGPLSAIATTLDIPVADLWAAWERSGPGIVTDPGLGRLTDAINRLAEVLEGRWRVLDEMVEEGIDADPDPAPADPRPPASMHRRPPDAT